MNFSFQNMNAFWGLLALAIPIAIHLLSRSKGKMIMVGSIKWIKSAERTQAHSIRLNEYALLCLRTLIVFLLILLLANPMIETKNSTPSGELKVIDARLVGDPLFNNLLDSLKDNSLNIRYLSGSQLLKNLDDGGDTNPDIFEALKEIDQRKKYDEVTFYTQGFVSEFEGEIPKVSFNFNLIQLPSEGDSEFELLTRKITEDSSFITSQYLDGNNLLTRKEFTRNDEDFNQEKLFGKTAIVVDDGSNEVEVNEWARIFESFETHKEINFKFLGIIEPIEVSIINDYPNMIVWVGEMANLEIAEKSSLIIYNPSELYDGPGEIIVQSQKNIYKARRRISPLLVYNEELLREVFRILYHGEVSNDKMQETDVRQITQRFDLQTKQATASSSVQDLSYPFWILLFLTLVTERILALKRNQ